MLSILAYIINNRIIYYFRVTYQKGAASGYLFFGSHSLRWYKLANEATNRRSVCLSQAERLGYCLEVHVCVGVLELQHTERSAPFTIWLF